MTADDVVRASMAAMPVPHIPDPPAYITPPPLDQARVAVVTTAGLMRHGEKAWSHDDTHFNVFRRDDDLIVGHVSMSFDRSGVTADRNVAVPVDRLAELAEEGVIGSVADEHISFMGALRADDLLRTLMLDTGPAAASVLKDDGVDVVVLTPMCPACGRTINLLGHVFEQHGIASVVLASNLALAETARPPRALFCDFPLGRPLGKPGDPAFQRRVLGAAFALLDRPDGSVLETFPERIEDEADTPVACTLPPRYDPDVPAPIDEARALRPAWERTRTKVGTSHVGRRIGADGVPEAIASFLDLAGGRRWNELFDDPDHLFQAAMDIRCYYEEAALALADHVPAARATEAWFFQRTETGSAFKDVVRVLQETGQEQELGLLASLYLVPLSQTPTEGGGTPWDGLLKEHLERD